MLMWKVRAWRNHDVNLTDHGSAHEKLSLCAHHRRCQRSVLPIPAASVGVASLAPCCCHLQIRNEQVVNSNHRDVFGTSFTPVFGISSVHMCNVLVINDLTLSAWSHQQGSWNSYPVILNVVC